MFMDFFERGYMKDQVYEIDLLELVHVIIRHWKAIIATTVAAAIIGFVVTYFFIAPVYESTSMMIVNTRQDASTAVTNDQLTSASKLTSTYGIIIKSDTVLNQVIKNTGISEDYKDVKDCVTVNAVNATQVMSITVRHTDPEWAYRVCNEINQVAPQVIVDAVEAGSVKLISQATYSEEKVAPSNRRNTMLAALIGLIVSVGFVVIRSLLDNKIKTEEDVAKYLGIPVIGVIPLVEKEGRK